MIVVAALLGVFLWREAVARIVSPLIGNPTGADGLLTLGLATGGLLVVGLALFAGVYVTIRGIDLGRTLPARTDSTLVAIAAVVPPVLVGLTALVGAASGVPFGTLTTTTFGPDVESILVVAGLGLLTGVPALVVICQIVLQRSFSQVLGEDRAVVLTTVVAGFVMTSNTGGLGAIPDQDKVIGAAAFALAVGVALYATEYVERDWVRYLAYVPVAALALLTVLSGMAAIESVAAGLYATTTLAVLGLAAYTYARTDSLLTPALAYVSLFVATDTVLFVLATGA